MYKKTLNNIPTSEIINYLKEGRNKAFLVWGVEDIIKHAKEQEEVTLTKSQAKEIIQGLNNSTDCNLGITCDVINCHVTDYIKDNNLTILGMPTEFLDISKNSTSSFVSSLIARRGNIREQQK